RHNRHGRHVARDNQSIAPNIRHSPWSSPSHGNVHGLPLIFFAAGNGIIYPFKTHPQQGLLPKVWQFDFDPTAPKTNLHKYNSNRREGPSNFYGMPVCYRNRVDAGGGGALWWGKNQAWVKCLDATGCGEITADGLVGSERWQ